MFKKLLIGLVLLFSAFQAQGQTSTINALNFPGANGDYAIVSELPHIRTAVGISWSLGVVAYVDTLDPANDGFLFQFKRASNDSLNHGIKYDNSGNRFCYVYNSNETVCSSAISATTWYLVALTYTSGGNVTLYVYTVPAGTLHDSDAIASGGSNADDDDPTGPSFGGYETAATINGEFDGRMALMFKIHNVALTSGQLQDYAIDPLAEGDAWVAAYGANMNAWWDSTITCPSSICTDVSGNAETATLQGGVTLGAANGPTIPDRAGGGGGGLLKLRRSRE